MSFIRGTCCGRASHPRSLRHRRRRRRAVGRGGGGGARRAGGADRKGPDGRRTPQHRLRAVEGDDRRGPARRGVPHQRAVRHQGSPSPPIEFAEVNDHVHRVIDAIAPNDSKERFTGLGVRVIEGEARFRDARTVVVGPELDAKFEIKARRFVIATGSRPVGAADPRPRAGALSHQRERIRAARAAEASDRARRRPVGLELAQAFRRLGSEVTVLDMAQPLGQEDPECAAIVLDAFAREGITIRSGVKVERVRRLRQRIEVVLAGDTEETIQGTDLLVATGRRPNIDGLDLDAARIKHEPHGIVVNKRFAHQQQARLCDRRRHRPAGVHPCRQPPGRPADPPSAVPPADQHERRRDPARDLHRSGARPCRPDRRAGARAPRRHPRAALALSRQRPRPGRARDRAAISRW